MLKLFRTGGLVLFFAIVAAGCTTSGPIGMDGRVKNIDELAASMSYKYNVGQRKVAHKQSSSKHHQHYGDFAMTLFNVRATSGNLPDMIKTFRNYCWYLGGVQMVSGRGSENSKAFGLGCEPKELREVGKFRSRNDSRYYLYFVNVVITPRYQKDQADKVAKMTDLDNASLYVQDRHYAYINSTYQDKLKNRKPISRLANGYYTEGHATHYRHSIGFYDNRQHANGFSTLHPHTHQYYTKPLNPKNPVYTRSHNTNPYLTAPRPARPANPGVYCVNFLVSENQTYNTALTKLPNYKKYRKQFISVLNDTKAFC